MNRDLLRMQELKSNPVTTDQYPTNTTSLLNDSYQNKKHDTAVPQNFSYQLASSPGCICSHSRRVHYQGWECHYCDCAIFEAQE